MSISVLVDASWLTAVGVSPVQEHPDTTSNPHKTETQATAFHRRIGSLPIKNPSSLRKMELIRILYIEHLLTCYLNLQNVKSI